MPITNYDKEKDILALRCYCGHHFESDSSQFISRFVEEFQEYENYQADCPKCGMTIFPNMNIPISEYEEYELEMTVMPFYDINTRKYLRDFIWAKREDLAQVNRKAFNQEQLRLLRK